MYTDLDLARAVHRGELERIRSLVAAGHDVNACYEGRNMLFLAVRNGMLPTVKLLLQFSADVDARTNGGSTPLFRAAQDGRAAVMNTLLEDPRTVDAINRQRSGGRTPLFVAAQHGHTDCVRLLMEKRADANMCVKHNGREWTPLQIAEKKRTAVSSPAEASRFAAVVELLAAPSAKSPPVRASSGQTISAHDETAADNTRAENRLATLMAASVASVTSSAPAAAVPPRGDLAALDSDTDESGTESGR